MLYPLASYRDEYTGVYSLGSKVFMLGMVAASSLPLSKTDLNMQEHLNKINKRNIGQKWNLIDFTKEIDTIRENGYILQEVDHRTGQVCIAAPIFNKGNEFLGTFSIVVSKSKLNKYTGSLIIEDITQSAEIISKQSR